MASKKSTKRALLMSALSLLLCVSMLVGTTFAWFTDEVKSGTNVIATGNLDVELTHTNREKNNEKVDENELLFTDVAADKWEPGAVAYEKLTVTNAGTLALKYQLAINVAAANSVEFEGEYYTLADALQVAFVDASKLNGNREDAIAAGDEAGWAPLSSTVKSGTLLEKDASYTYGVVIYWEPTENDNIWNLKNGKKAEDGADKLSIELGVHLTATQLVKENDSYGDDYDEEAIYTDAVVENEDELKAALANAKDNMVIGIRGNVTWTTGAGIGSTPFVEAVSTLAANAAQSNLSITLLGVEDGATFTAIGSGVGAIGIDGGTVTFKNLKIVDNSVSYAENNWEYGYLEFRGNTVFENCEIVNAIMMEGENAEFKNCSFNSNKDSEYAVWVSNGNASFENCTFTGARGVKIHEAYGSEVGSVTINDNTFIDLSKKPGLAIGTVNANTTVVLTNNEFIGTQAGDNGNYKYETDTDVTTFAFTDENNKVYAQDSNLTQGLYKVDDTTWMAINNNALNAAINEANDGDTIILGQDTTYTGNGYANITKNITLDLNGNTLSTTSLGVVAKAGTIKNGTISNPVGKRAALRTWSGVSIENVTVEAPENGGITVAEGNTLPSIKNVTINAKTYGIELQYGASVGTIENVNIVAGENGIVVKGGTIGNIENSVIEGANAGVWAQLKGKVDLKLQFTDCEISGGVYGLYVCDEGATVVPDGVAYLNYDEATTFAGSVEDKKFAFGQQGKLIVNGAKIGAFISTADELFAFAKEVNENGKNFKGMTVYLTADIDLENKVWTPIGQTGATEFKGVFDGQNYTIKNLNIDNSAKTDEHTSSGLFGWAESGVTIKNVKVDGAKVVGNHNVAVIVGYTYSGKVINCHVANAEIVCNHANNNACGDKCGLIAGYAGDESRFTDCSASNSTVKAGRDAGQLLGLGYNVSVSNCTATNVTVTAGGDCPKENNINNAIIGRVMG